jgi:ribosomal protein L32
MAVQKKRKTRSRRDMRRSQIKARKPSLTSDELTDETHIGIILATRFLPW